MVTKDNNNYNGENDSLITEMVFSVSGKPLKTDEKIALQCFVSLRIYNGKFNLEYMNQYCSQGFCCSFRFRK